MLAFAVLRCGGPARDPTPRRTTRVVVGGSYNCHILGGWRPVVAPCHRCHSAWRPACDRRTVYAHWMLLL